jgi:MoxR-like ATPase
VGKSQIVAQVASDLDWQVLDIRAVQLDPVDLRGSPRIFAVRAEWVPPKFLPTSGRGILVPDELTAAPQMTRPGCYQLVLDRKLGEYHLPDDWVVVAAGNPASERGVHFFHAPAAAQSVRPPMPRDGLRRLVPVGGSCRAASQNRRFPAVQAGTPA